jgi:hypothetical protein
LIDTAFGRDRILEVLAYMTESMVSLLLLFRLWLSVALPAIGLTIFLTVSSSLIPWLLRLAPRGDCSFSDVAADGLSHRLFKWSSLSSFLLSRKKFCPIKAGVV